MADKNKEEELVEEIVNQVLKEVYGKKEPSGEVSGVDRRTLKDLIKLRNRVEALENRVGKMVRLLDTESMEAERHVVASTEEAKGSIGTLEERVADLQGQVKEMRVNIIDMADRLKREKPRL